MSDKPTEPEKATDLSKDADAKQQTSFLEKTYELLEECPDGLACWNPDGLSFAVKDPKKFAENIIPKYFRHNKFSSFVRQLNFYGFRKMKADSDSGKDLKGVWEFRHPKFVRGQRDLLKGIRRKTYSDSNIADQTQVDELQVEVKDLRNQVKNLQDAVQRMEGMLEQALAFNNDQPVVPASPNPLAASKKRKLKQTSQPKTHIALKRPSLAKLPIARQYSNISMSGLDKETAFCGEMELGENSWAELLDGVDLTSDDESDTVMSPVSSSFNSLDLLPHKESLRGEHPEPTKAAEKKKEPSKDNSSELKECLTTLPTSLHQDLVAKLVRQIIKNPQATAAAPTRSAMTAPPSALTPAALKGVNVPAIKTETAAPSLSDKMPASASGVPPQLPIALLSCILQQVVSALPAAALAQYPQLGAQLNNLPVQS